MRLRSSITKDDDVSLQKVLGVKVEAEPIAELPSRRSRRSVKTETVEDGGASGTVGVKREKVDAGIANTPPVKKKKKRTKGTAVDTKRIPREAPRDWRDILKGIEEMRANKDAEVDKYGCEVFFDESFLPHVCRFHVLIAAMMSSQTKDPVNAAAMGRLIKHGLTVESMLAIDQKELALLIHPVGFFNNKAKYIKQVAAILTKQADGAAVIDIPNTYEGLIALPGVGPKMATLVMGCAWNKYVSVST
ncbi:hypothetical protein BBJ28_00025091 [Nothophytophthora sp. Chile5]|nr:hypothetical protein BBJ28_00025091 [Nothophytophthora sp. Chile5]